MLLGFQRFYSFETSNISNVVLFDDLGFWKIKKQHTFTILVKFRHVSVFTLYFELIFVLKEPLATKHDLWHDINFAFKIKKIQRHVFCIFNLFTGTKIRPSAKFVHSYVIFAQSCKCCMQTGLKSLFRLIFFFIFS